MVAGNLRWFGKKLGPRPRPTTHRFFISTCMTTRRVIQYVEHHTYVLGATKAPQYYFIVPKLFSVSATVYACGVLMILHNSDRVLTKCLTESLSYGERVLAILALTPAVICDCEHLGE